MKDIGHPAENASRSSPKGLMREGVTRSGWRVAMALVGWLGLCFAAGAIGSLAAPDAWYASIRKPSWNPPAWVFGPVWSVLYFSMAIAAWRVWRRGGWKDQGPALRWFCTQLALNALWSPLFFGLKAPGWALAEILVLWFALWRTLQAFRSIDTISAWLLWPYLAWVSFASVLNATLWWMNR